MEITPSIYEINLMYRHLLSSTSQRRIKIKEEKRKMPKYEKDEKVGFTK